MTLPEKLGRYVIEGRLGAGAMGEVFIARDPQIERLCALKTLKLVGVADADRAMLRDRLLFEAKAAGQLVHPNVVTLFDTGEDAGVVYLAFEYVEGCHLADRVSREPTLTLGEVLRITREVASALDLAQTRGIVHRDIKPSNILIDTNGTAKVADFGIAKMRDRASDLTVTGAIIGTPHYMSPEQIRADSLDGRSDVFSLGAVLFELLHRARPFRGDTITTLVYQILHHDPLPQLRPDLPPQLRTLLCSMLEKELEDRLWAGDVVRSLDDMLRALPRELLETPITKRPWPQAAGAAAASLPPLPGLESGELSGSTTAASGAEAPHAESPAEPPSSAAGGAAARTTTVGTSTADAGAVSQAPVTSAAPGPQPPEARRGIRPLWVAAGCLGVAAILLLAGIFAISGFVERWMAERDLEPGGVDHAAVAEGVSGDTAPPSAGRERTGAEDQGRAPQGDDQSGLATTRASDAPSESRPGGDQVAGSGGDSPAAAALRRSSSNTTNQNAPPGSPPSVDQTAGATPAQRATGGRVRESIATGDQRLDRNQEDPPPASTRGAEPQRGAAAAVAPPVEDSPAGAIDRANDAPSTSSPATSSPISDEESSSSPTPVPPDQVLTTGTSLSFEVSPENAYILVRRPSEERFVQIGQVEDHDLRKRRRRPWNLPGSGAFEMILRAPGYRDHLILLDATAGGPTTIRAQLERGQPGGASPR